MASIILWHLLVVLFGPECLFSFGKPWSCYIHYLNIRQDVTKGLKNSNKQAFCETTAAKTKQHGLQLTIHQRCCYCHSAKLSDPAGRNRPGKVAGWLQSHTHRQKQPCPHAFSPTDTLSSSECLVRIYLECSLTLERRYRHRANMQKGLDSGKQICHNKPLCTSM